jgi:hypothetical protein
VSQTWLVYLPVYLAFSLPILAAALILIGRMFRPGFQGQWPVAVLSVLLTWGLVIYLRPQASLVVPLLPWQPPGIFPAAPLLLVDNISWSYAMALTTLAVGILFTAPARFSDKSWLAWFGSLSFTGLGLIAVWAGNPLSLLVAWCSLDILELIVEFAQVSHSNLRERLVAAFSARIAGTTALILAVVLASTQQIDLNFQNIPAFINPILILAAGLRLNVLPVLSPLLQEIPLRRGVGTALRMVPASASLVLLTRTAAIHTQPVVEVVFLILAALAAFYSALAWLNSTDELSGRPFWMQGFAAMAVAAAVHGQPAASLAWGLALLLSGGMLFLHSARNPRLDTIIYLGLIAACAAPMTPAWAGILIFDWRNDQSFIVLRVLASGLFFMALWLLLLGFVRHLIRPVEPETGIQPWIWLVYIPGLLLLPAVQLWLGWLSRPPLANFSGITWWIGPLILLILAGSLIWRQRMQAIVSIQSNLREGLAWGATFWGQVLSLTWLYRMLWSIYNRFGRLLRAVTRLLEGDGGLLWAILLLLLIFSILLPGSGMP